ncbi:MAG: NIPSNAP family protein [Chitinophagaceae bacterium]|nr:NIPSNAP family protein [Chitinophagaceae bacterium]
MQSNFRYAIPAIALSLFTLCYGTAQSKKEQRTFYEIKVYHFATTEQEALLDHYLSKAYLPALHRAGIKQVGAFKPLANDTAADKRLYVLIPHSSPEQWVALPQQLQKDADYNTIARPYNNAPYDAAPYTRMESIILRAFRLAPQLTPPRLKGDKKDRIYELRSYESATEKQYWKKVHMFNEGGEIPLFNRLRFNAIFYGEVIAGSRMPNLMYMTSFENLADRNAHWDTFREDSEWKILSAKPEYQHIVIRNETILTTPTSYSDF